ncbi:Uncharacterised protein [Bordetella pertussis]|nr:Uncharacterised protein [Bordetella pertussis]CFL94744.1 Uncharacterised protein [Bordetella pertussis]CFM25236.1 Uncharacterised protein [Bordetella pertussis]CFM41600.1 Uncharacterised protein [Bordetella pertussis]CFM45386.1 Uncharacterised protein [Bordetella pertussis]
MSGVPALGLPYTTTWVGGMSSSACFAAAWWSMTAKIVIPLARKASCRRATVAAKG